MCSNPRALQELCNLRVGDMLSESILGKNAQFESRWNLETRIRVITRTLDSIPIHAFVPILFCSSARLLEEFNAYFEKRGVETELVWEELLKTRWGVTRKRLMKPTSFESLGHVAPFNSNLLPDDRFSFRRAYLERHFCELLHNYNDPLFHRKFNSYQTAVIFNFTLPKLRDSIGHPMNLHDYNKILSEEQIRDLCRFCRQLRKFALIGTLSTKLRMLAEDPDLAAAAAAEFPLDTSSDSDAAASKSWFYKALARGGVESMTISRLDSLCKDDVLTVVEAVKKGGQLRNVLLRGVFQLDREAVLKFFQIISTDEADNDGGVDTLELDVKLDEFVEDLDVIFPAPTPELTRWRALKKLRLSESNVDVERVLKHLRRCGYLERLTHLLMEVVFFPSALDFLFAVQSTSTPEKERRELEMWGLESLDEDFKQEEEIEEPPPLHLKMFGLLQTITGGASFDADLFSSFRRRPVASLDLSRNKFSADGIAKLVVWLNGGSQHLTTLRLRDCSLSATFLESLLSTLHRAPRLRNLDIGFNILDGDAGRAFCKYLKANQCSLVELSLATCFLSGLILNGSLDAFVDGLRRNDRLKYISFSGNRLKSGAVDLMCKLLAPSEGTTIYPFPDLSELDLSFNFIPEDSMASLAEALAGGRPLDRLVLSGNPVASSNKAETIALFSESVIDVDLLILDLGVLFADHVAHM